MERSFSDRYSARDDPPTPTWTWTSPRATAAEPTLQLSIRPPATAKNDQDLPHHRGTRQGGALRPRPRAPFVPSRGSRPTACTRPYHTTRTQRPCFSLPETDYRCLRLLLPTIIDHQRPRNQARQEQEPRHLLAHKVLLITLRTELLTYLLALPTPHLVGNASSSREVRASN